MNKQFIESKINDITKYFADKQPENITFIDADTYDYELFTLYEKWKQLVLITFSILLYSPKI